MLRKASVSFLLLGLLVGMLPGVIQAAPPAQSGGCGDPATLIHEIQGDGARSDMVGEMVTIEGVVTGDFQASDQLEGFYVQEEPDDVDDNDETSEGVFIYESRDAVDAGDVVRVTGKVAEYEALTELSNVEEVVVCGTADVTIEPVALTFPVEALADLERYEHMLVTIPQEMTVSELYNLGRYGEIGLAAEGRLWQPTNAARPGAAADAVAEANLRRSIILDDGSTQSNLDPIRFPAGGLDAQNVLRAGYTVTDVTGVLDERFDSYRIEASEDPVFVASEPRTDKPTDVGGRLKVASFNVLNYFNGNGEGGGFPTPRGADSAREFTRQEIKIVNAILALDADVVGLIEIENDGDGPNSALVALVDALNEEAGDAVYAHVDDPVGQRLPDEGGDAIKQAIIYRPARVNPVGEPFALLEPPFDNRRPPVAQAFEEVASGEIFIVVVNHLKSKGCDGADDAGDGDTGDGQGCWNAERTEGALAMISWLAVDPSGTGDPDALLIGDFNAYAMEDPIMAFADGGYTNLTQVYEGDENYSYIYFGQAGSLDHALASASLVPQVTGVTTWHINADEPRVFDYNVEFKTQNLVERLYDPGPFRSSDHDPLVIGLALDDGEPTEEPTAEPTSEPTVVPTEEPTEAPTAEPTEVPTVEPTDAPTEEPTEAPTAEPTVEPADDDSGAESDSTGGTLAIIAGIVAVFFALLAGIWGEWRRRQANE